MNKLFFTTFILFFKFQIFSQNCNLLDSILSSSNKYIFGNFVTDSLIIDNIESEKIRLLIKSFEILNLETQDRFYLIYDSQYNKKNKSLTYKIEEYRKGSKNQVIETYEWTKCSFYYRRYNKANFIIKFGRLYFKNWDYE